MIAYKFWDFTQIWVVDDSAFQRHSYKNLSLRSTQLNPAMHWEGAVHSFKGTQ